MNKRILVFMAWVAMVLPVLAVPMELVMELHDGSKDRYQFADQPVMQILENKQVRVYSDVMDLTYAMAEVERFYVQEVQGQGPATGFEDAAQTETQVFAFRFVAPKVVEIEGAESARVYSVSGTLLQSTTGMMDSAWLVDMSTLPNGTYLITTNNGKSVKVYLK